MRSVGNKDKNEILFAMGSVFLIKSIELFSDNVLFIVLALTDEMKKEVGDILGYFTKHELNNFIYVYKMNYLKIILI